MKSKRKNAEIFKNYVGKLSDDDLKYLNIRLSERIEHDISEAVDMILKDVEVDKLMGEADNAFGFFDMLDEAEVVVQRESKRRFS